MSRLRAAVACGAHDEALSIFDDIREQGDMNLNIRGRIQLALLHHSMGDESSSLEFLRDAKGEAEDCRSRLRESDDTIVDRLPAFDALFHNYLEMQLQLARAWYRVGRLLDAQETYLDLLRQVDTDSSDNRPERHIAAIAEYRLADLRVEEAPLEAYKRWRRVVELRDEEVSPYAALRMALQIGDSQLVSERVERLFHYAMGTGDPDLYAEAALGLARHLKERHEFGEARRYLDAILKVDLDTQAHEEAGTELEKLKRFEQMVKTRNQLRRPQQLQAKARRGIGSPLDDTRRTIIVGAGSGGSYLLESLDPRRYTVCGFVDDFATDVPGHPEYPILGRIEDLAGVLQDLQPDEVLLAVPTLPGVKRRRVAITCRKLQIPLLNLPGVHELGIGWTKKKSRCSLMNQLRPVRVAETLGDDQRTFDTVATSWLQFKTALVIGAGAIGAELCRRLADAEVVRLIVVDKRESALKKIESELRDFREFWAVEVRLGDAAESGFLEDIFESAKPYVVFNASGAASARAFDEDRLSKDPRGWKSLFDNEVGVAWHAARAAGEQAVPRMVHVSTRRARSSGDPLGATKSLCEELVLRHALDYPDTMHTVARIGHLFDSRNGYFAALEGQIRAGAAVKIPPAGIRASFLPAARWAELVLHVGRIASAGELFEPEGGVEFSPRQVAEEAIELAGLYQGDVAIEEAARELWRDPRSGARRELKGEPGLGLWALAESSVSRDKLREAIDRCARVVDAGVTGGSGEAAAQVTATLRRLCEAAELVRQ
ncbi:MAG TPA: polysaccharide biosynthesis protein [Solirubrobacterales bacterium]|nr:polysaccharide biosynthesis protein [Solirubrobacterales bacterium]